MMLKVLIISSVMLFSVSPVNGEKKSSILDVNFFSNSGVMVSAKLKIKNTSICIQPTSKHVPLSQEQVAQMLITLQKIIRMKKAENIDFGNGTDFSGAGWDSMKYMNSENVSVSITGQENISLFKEMLMPHLIKLLNEK